MPYFNKNQKNATIVQLFEEAITILALVGIPVSDKSERSLERMAMAFLAVAGVTKAWNEASEKRFLKTRDIINFINQHFDESISSGSYDDIRRKDLKLLVVAGLILNSSDKPDAATNDPTRGYSLSSEFKNLLQSFRKQAWHDTLRQFMANKESLDEILQRKRTIDKVPIHLPNGKLLELSLGKHNDL
jgi:BsuBI/PstI restriction endonuclease HTH domain